MTGSNFPAKSEPERNSRLSSCEVLACRLGKNELRTTMY
jgi:hypothetical protein